ncbi:MAG: hypothetical protein HOH43_27125, partial [Candidatus Latescibacteria bacterium]|nr:hypothetical protein [Candidatus Latescibacterota bacterium]
MPIETDISTTDVTAYMLPIETRLPLKFGAEILTRISCARIRIGVCRADGETAYGWGETPMSVQWVWPSAISYEERESTMITFIR